MATVPESPHDMFKALADPAAWDAIGYEPFPLAAPTNVPEPVLVPTIKLAAARDQYDIVIVGSGAGGGIAARVLAETGASVLIIERGGWVDRDAPTMNHLRNHRIPVLGDGTSPHGHPRAVFRGGVESIIDPSDLAYQNNAIAIGGGTRMFGAQAWRFHPDDFRMASLYGIPDGSALADWPIGYDDLAPYYRKVEWDLGVAADGDYPMPAFPPGLEDRMLIDAADRLGWSTVRVPLLINTQPRDNRPACVRCGFCVGFPCPVDAKNGSDVAALPRAVGLGADIVAGAQVNRIADDGRVDVADADGNRRTINALRILLGAGAIETARLLQVSGLGNDWVGDCLQGHTYAGAYGRYDDIVNDGIGPGPSVATREFAHGNDGIIGGGQIANDFVKLPAFFYFLALPPGAPRHGQAGLDEIAQWYRRTSQVWGPVHEIPTRDARVRLSTTLDAAGIPIARLEGSQHPEDLRTAAFLSARSETWLQATGARTTWQTTPTITKLSGGQHQAGTARMSDTPDHGATDTNGRVWGTDRIYVVDGSVHVTNGGANPVLTIMALAWRTAELLTATV